MSKELTSGQSSDQKAEISQGKPLSALDIIRELYHKTAYDVLRVAGVSYVMTKQPNVVTFFVVPEGPSISVDRFTPYLASCLHNPTPGSKISPPVEFYEMDDGTRFGQITFSEETVPVETVPYYIKVGKPEEPQKGIWSLEVNVYPYPESATKAFEAHKKRAMPTTRGKAVGLSQPLAERVNGAVH